MTLPATMTGFSTHRRRPDARRQRGPDALCSPDRRPRFELATRPIPGSGERLPVIGIGTSFDSQYADFAAVRAKELGIASWAQFALKFVVSHPAVTVAIPGTARPQYLADNLAAGRGPMPDATTRQRMIDLITRG